MIKEVPNISSYSVLDGFISFIQSKTFLYIFNGGVIYLLFKSKRFVTYLILLPSIFNLFHALNYTSLHIVNKLVLIFLKIKIYYIYLKVFQDIIFYNYFYIYKNVYQSLSK